MINFVLIFLCDINQKSILLLLYFLLNFLKLFINFFFYFYFSICILLLVNSSNFIQFILILLFHSNFHIFDLFYNTLSNIWFHISYFLLIIMSSLLNILNVLTMGLFIHRNEFLNLLSSFGLTFIYLFFIFLSHSFSIFCKHFLNFHILLF